MKIYGVAFLAACYLIGQSLGQFLGALLGLDSNVGGVGLAMLLLVLVNDYFNKRTGMNPETRNGVLFWSSMYIPVVVAMASILNVKAAISGGWVAAFAALLATSGCYLLIPLLSRLADKNIQQHS